MTGGPPLALFDMDRTLTEGRTVLRLADHFGVRDGVEAIWDAWDPHQDAGRR